MSQIYLVIRKPPAEIIASDDEEFDSNDIATYQQSQRKLLERSRRRSVTDEEGDAAEDEEDDEEEEEKELEPKDQGFDGLSKAEVKRALLGEVNLLIYLLSVEIWLNLYRVFNGQTMRARLRTVENVLQRLTLTVMRCTNVSFARS
jgi:hypothetical protein